MIVINKLLVLPLMLAPLLGAAQGNTSGKVHTFSLSGKVADSSPVVDNIIYLSYTQNRKQIKDSTKLVDGNYTFKGLISYPVEAVIQLKVADSVEQYHKQTRILKDYAHEFYIDKGKMTANAPAKLNSTIVTGSAADTDRQQLKSMLDPYYQTSNKMYEEEGSPSYKNKDSIAIAKYTIKSNAIQHQIDSVKKAFLFSNPQSGTVLDMLSEYTRTILEPSEIEPFFNKIQPALKGSLEGKQYANRIQRSKATANGAIAQNFTLKDRNGKEVSLSALKGKLVLLDFWGSWCFPCRQTHPHLRKLYAEYKSKGFEILGVANERGTPAEHYKKWTKALDEDQMNWINVLSVESENGKPSVASTYNVNAYPTKVLINKDGVIVKKFVGSGQAATQELDNLLAQMLK